jgi:hypothetical protein
MSDVPAGSAFGKRTYALPPMERLELRNAILATACPLYAETLEIPRTRVATPVDTPASLLQLPRDAQLVAGAGTVDNFAHALAGMDEANMRELGTDTLQVISTLKGFQRGRIVASKPTGQLLHDVWKRLPSAEVRESLEGFEILDALALSDVGLSPAPITDSRLMKMITRSDDHGPVLVIGDAGWARHNLALDWYATDPDLGIVIVDFGKNGTPWKYSSEAVVAGATWLAEVQAFAKQVGDNAVVINPEHVMTRGLEL